MEKLLETKGLKEKKGPKTELKWSQERKKAQKGRIEVYLQNTKVKGKAKVFLHSIVVS